MRKIKTIWSIVISLVMTMGLLFSACGGSDGTSVTVTFTPANSATGQTINVTITATFSGTITPPSDWSTVFTVTETIGTINLCTATSGEDTGYSWNSTTRVVTCLHDDLSNSTQYTATISGLASVTNNSATFTTRAAGYTVFVTSLTYNGDLGGLSGADALCNTRATAGGLSGTYAAWLSADAVGETAAVDAKDRIVDTTYITTAGVTVVAGLTELLTGTLQNAIDRDESGNEVSAEENVWTGTYANGTVIETDNCDAWETSLSGQDSYTGSNNATTGGLWTFTETTSYNCDNSKRLYCFQISE